MHKLIVPEPINLVDASGEPVKKSVMVGGREMASGQDDDPWTLLRFLEEIVFTDQSMSVGADGKPLGRKGMKVVNRVRRALKPLGVPAVVGAEVLLDSADHEAVLKSMNEPGTPRPMSIYAQFEPFVEAWESAVEAGKLKSVPPPAPAV